jgi:integrase
VRQAYFKFCLLTGLRPGEAARARWENLDLRKRWLIIPNSKNRSDIRVPLSLAIVGVLKMARDCDRRGSSMSQADKGFIFPTCKTATQHATALPQRGMDLRRTWESLASELGVSEEHRSAMTGHTAKGMPAKYVRRIALMESATIRREQARISAEIMRRLGIGL